MWSGMLTHLTGARASAVMARHGRLRGQPDRHDGRNRVAAASWRRGRGVRGNPAKHRYLPCASSSQPILNHGDYPVCGRSGHSPQGRLCISMQSEQLAAGQRAAAYRPASVTPCSAVASPELLSTVRARVELGKLPWRGDRAEAKAAGCCTLRL